MSIQAGSTWTAPGVSAQDPETGNNMQVTIGGDTAALGQDGTIVDRPLDVPLHLVHLAIGATKYEIAFEPVPAPGDARQIPLQHDVHAAPTVRMHPITSQDPAGQAEPCIIHGDGRSPGLELRGIDQDIVLREIRAGV